MSNAFPYLLFAFLAALSFTSATMLQPTADQWSRRDDSGGILKVLLGDGRRLFANHFFVKADVTFHSGYYPSIFDQAASPPKDTEHLKRKDEHEHEADEHGHGGTAASTNLVARAESDSEHEAEEAHEKAMAFLKPPRDWIEKFGRNFIITEHAHLQGNKEREMLPWLRISAELNPDNPETYTVAAYWLRDMGKVKEAEAFLREGVRNNPDSYEIYFELGCLYYDNYHNTKQARNFWDLALKKWTASQQSVKEPDLLTLDKIAVHLAHLEEGEKNYGRAIALLQLASKATPHPELLQEQIKELEAKRAAIKP